MKGNGWIIGLVMFILILLALSQSGGKFFVKQDIPKKETVMVELPFCKTLDECKTVFREHGIPEEKIKEAIIKCDGTKCWGEAWIIG